MASIDKTSPEVSSARPLAWSRGSLERNETGGATVIALDKALVSSPVTQVTVPLCPRLRRCSAPPPPPPSRCEPPHAATRPQRRGEWNTRLARRIARDHVDSTLSHAPSARAISRREQSARASLFVGALTVSV